MKILRKSFVTTILLGALLVTGCSGGNGLVNEKEVKPAEFLAACAAAPENTYNVANVVGYAESTGNDGKAVRVEINEVWKYSGGKWVVEGKGSGAYELKNAAASAAEIVATFAKFGKGEVVKFFTADNGFEINGDFKMDATSGAVGGSACGSVVMIFNEFGFPTKEYADISSSIVTAAGTISTFAKSEVTVTYKSEN